MRARKGIFVAATDPVPRETSEPVVDAGPATPVMLRDVPRTVLAVLLIVILILASFWILRPFLLAGIWAMMIVVATWPLMLKVQVVVRSRGLAVTVMSLAMLMIFFAPVVLMIQTLADN